MSNSNLVSFRLPQNDLAAAKKLAAATNDLNLNALAKRLLIERVSSADLDEILTSEKTTDCTCQTSSFLSRSTIAENIISIFSLLFEESSDEQKNGSPSPDILSEKNIAQLLKILAQMRRNLERKQNELMLQKFDDVDGKNDFKYEIKDDEINEMLDREDWIFRGDNSD